MLARLLERLTNRMSRADQQIWQSAATLSDLGELTALWLEGRIASQPDYSPGYGPDPETEELIPVLAAANRCGFVTTSSQPGEDGPGYDGAHWRQRAAVEGFADDPTLQRLWAWMATVAPDVKVMWSKPRRRKFDYSACVTVSEREGRHVTGFGTVLSASQIEFAYGDDCSPAAVTALQDAWQVTIVDPEWGRNDRLWPALARFAGLED